MSLCVYLTNVRFSEISERNVFVKTASCIFFFFGQISKSSASAPQDVARHRVISRDIKRYRAISIEIKRYRTISSDIVRYRAISRDIARYRAISNDIKQNRPISSEIERDRTISSDITRYRAIFRNITRYRAISPVVSAAVAAAAVYRRRLWPSYTCLCLEFMVKGV